MVGSSLGHYRIVERIGFGGMGEVYRAHDLKLDRDVAIKVLPPDRSQDPIDQARLLREARLASGLNHPSVCTIHEVGEADGQSFIVMELIQGRSLRETIPADGLPAAEVARLGAQIADALAHAHAHGVIHRDLKSTNVMITRDGRAKVLDFGIAKRSTSIDEATRDQLTTTGRIIGTPQFMAPELLLGARADARSDLWALGVILYEMAAGKLPFAGRNEIELVAAILHAPPPPIPEHVPNNLAEVIQRCLARDPATRFESAAEVRAALEHDVEARTARGRPWISLRWAAGAAVLVLAVSIALIAPYLLKLWPSRSGDIRALAVLPLENLSGDAAQSYFVDGMTEQLITCFAQISSLKVIARPSVMGYRDHPKRLRDIGRELGVQALIVGSVVPHAGRVRITLQLVQAANEQTLWADGFERDVRDILALQSEVARAVVERIHLKLDPEEHSRLASARPVDPAAFQAYLKGRQAWNKYTEEGLLEAARFFQQAVEMDPTFAPAYAGLADAYYGRSSMHEPPNLAIPRAHAAAERALALDSLRAETHTSLAILKMVYDWDWSGAEAGFKRAIELAPADANSHLWLGHLLVCRGSFDEGVAEIRRALELDPLSSWINANVGWHLYFARRYDEAEAHLATAVRMEPDVYIHRVFLGLVYSATGKHEKAVAELEKAVEMETNNDNLAQLAHTYGVAGRRTDATRILRQLEERSTRQFVPASSMAVTHLGLGNHDQALVWFEKALEDHSEWLIFLKVDPTLDPLRTDTRFVEIVRRVGLDRT